MTGAPKHSPMTQFAVADNCLQVGGIALTRLVERVGRTPFYAYDRVLLSARVAHLRGYLPPTVRLNYAIKANPMPALVCYMAGLVDGLDVASAGELRVALDTGIDPARISLAGPGKLESELKQAIASGILVNVESAREVGVLARESSRLGLPARVAVRVNPDFELKSAGMKMGGASKQFGVDAADVPELLADIGRMQLAFEGFHIYCGSQNLNADAICEAQYKSVELAVQLARSAPGPVRVLNIGGGFGIPYFPGESPLDLTPIGRTLSELSQMVASSLPGAHLVIELGRYLVGEAGIYVCRILDRKVSRGRPFLVTDGGLHHHLAASGNFGQVIRKNYPVVIGNRMTADTTEIASIVGPLCTPLDLLADQMELPQAQPGDLVVVFQSGAYGASASPIGFLSHPMPVEVLV
jgi:diaminopimelate decarboxylase